jgi:uncharacterized protein (TIGR00255 family)
MTVASMTGFSTFRGQTKTGLNLRVEIRSVNHRFIDIRLKLPKEFQSTELLLKNWIQKQISRGSLDIRIEIEKDLSASVVPTTLNLSVAVAYHQQLKELKEILQITTPITLKDLLSLPEVFSRTQPLDAKLEEETQGLFQELQTFLETPVLSIKKMREKEGAALYSVLIESLQQLKTKTALLEKFRDENTSKIQGRIKERLEQLFTLYPMGEQSAKSLMESRLAQELSILLERTDIQEELVRLEKHIQHFQEVLTQGGPVGKKLEFLLQELQREANTLSNKSQDFQMSEHAVQVKVLIEQMREQTLNLE